MVGIRGGHWLPGRFTLARPVRALGEDDIERSRENRRAARRTQPDESG